MPSVGTTPWVSVAPSVVDDLAVDAMADDDAAYGTAAEVTCTVCVEPIVLPGKLNGATDPAVCMRGCAHVFHRGCLIRWLSTHPSCPNCRNKLCMDMVHNRCLFMDKQVLPRRFGARLQGAGRLGGS